MQLGHSTSHVFFFWDRTACKSLFVFAWQFQRSRIICIKSLHQFTYFTPALCYSVYVSCSILLYCYAVYLTEQTCSSYHALPFWERWTWIIKACVGDCSTWSDWLWWIWCFQNSVQLDMQWQDIYCWLRQFSEAKRQHSPTSTNHEVTGKMHFLTCVYHTIENKTIKSITAEKHDHRYDLN